MIIAIRLADKENPWHLFEGSAYDCNLNFSCNRYATAPITYVARLWLLTSKIWYD